MKCNKPSISLAVLTSGEVAEFLGISRQRVSAMVKSGRINIMRETSTGPLFFFSDVAEYQRQRDRRYRKVFPHYSRDLSSAKAFVRENLLQIGEVSTIHVFFDEVDALASGFFTPDRDPFGIGLTQVQVPTFVIIGEKNHQIWVDSLQCGFFGSGPSASVEIIEEITGGLEIGESIRTNQVVSITKDDGRWQSESHLSDFARLRNLPDAYLRPRIPHFYTTGKALILAMDGEVKSEELQQVLEWYRRFIPIPSQVQIISRETPAASGPANRYEIFDGEVRTTFNLIIKDKSGNELWLSVSEEQLPRLSEDLTMQDVLSMYDLEPVKQSNAFFSWLNARPRSRKEHIRTYRAQ